MGDDRTLASGRPSIGSADTTSATKGQGSNQRPEAPAPRPGAPLPQRIGDYRILSKIGEGGMGVVYEAEQHHPRRAVALKVIRGGTSVNELHVRMFQREAQTLARLKHPNIAAIYESGLTEDGQHFFSMELVRGEPLDTFFTTRSGDGRLTPAEIRFRIAVLRRICDAVNYAHQRGVIHRDLKPSNILILPSSASGSSSDSLGHEIKVLDFGLARITDTDLASPTIVTEVGRIQGTAPYMSPEQLRGNPEEIDTRSDVYSLGVLLYELLAGARPYELDGIPMHQAAGVVCRQSPIPLKAVWRGARALDGDLETIVMKALEIEPGQRYQSAAAIAGDLERNLQDQPILARPPSALYQLRKMVTRHKAGFGFSAVLLGLLVAFAAVMSVQAGRVARERDRANLEAETANRVSRFLVDLFKVPDPEQALGEEVTARAVLDRGADTIRTELAQQPDVQARLMETMALSYTNLGLYEQGLSLAAESQSIRAELADGDDPELAAALQLLGDIQQLKGDYAESELLGRQALEMRRRLFGDRHDDVAASFNKLAIVLKLLGRPDEAEELYREALSIRRELLGDSDTLTTSTITSLAELLRTRGELDEAEMLLREALTRAREIHGAIDPLVGSCLNNLALVLQDKEELDDAERLLRETLELDRRLFGDEHPQITLDMNNLAALLRELKRYGEAEALHRETLALNRRLLRQGHPNIANSLNILAVVLQDQGELDEAEELLREALDNVRKNLGDDHPKVGVSLYNLARLQYMRKEWVAAEASYRAALPILEHTLPPGNWRWGYVRTRIGACLAKTGRHAEAEPWMVDGYAIVRDAQGEGDRRTRSALEQLVDMYDAWGKPAKADRYRALMTAGQS